MSLISKEMEQNIASGSMIRKMFEAGALLRAEHGADKVCDFSLGNPDLAAPQSVITALEKIAEKAKEPASLGYMPNAGFEFARNTLASYLSKEQNCSLTSADVVLTCGAAGGMNVFFRTVLNPGDEVLGISPFFVEYFKYVGSNNGVFKPISSQKDTFAPDIEALENAITEKTRAILINTPNNPSGVIYSEEDIAKLIELVERASKKYNTFIYLLADEPYRFLAYDKKVPSVLDKSAHAVIIGSFSKNLALAGERVGYIALSPLLEERDLLMGGLVQANRFLGFVNAPVIGQYLMDAALSSSELQKGLDEAKEVYAKRREIFSDILKSAGIEFQEPDGAFYFFIKSPTADESIFVAALKEQLILAVPGSGFGCPGYVRLSFAVPTEMIERSREGFKKAVESLK